MSDEGEVLRVAGDLAADFLASLDTRPIRQTASVAELRSALDEPLPEEGRDPVSVIEQLAAAAEPGLVGIPSGRYFGFVIGGALPAAVAADWLTTVWDQNAGLYACGPSASVVEEVAARWLCELLGIPAGSSVGFVTGCQMAHVTCLAAARHHVLAAAGWDLAAQGLAGSPPIRVVVGEARHATIDRALRLLGIGAGQIVAVPADRQRRMRVDALREELARPGPMPTIVCAQAGEVNTGAFDDLEGVADAAADAGAWLHVDGAFGLWAAASPGLRHLTAGSARADSWATDAHKFLNVPYDCGLALCARPEAHRAAMGTRADYLVQAEPGAERDAVDWVPEFSRRARGFTVYAAIRSLGRTGVAEMIERCCRHARRFAEELAVLPGCEVLNEVVLNQVLVRFGDDETTDLVLRRVQDEGEAWMSGTTFEGRRAIRISVSNWRTDDDDVTRAVAAFARAAG